MFDENKVADCFERLLTEGLGLDLSDPNLSDTPKRVARMYCREFFASVGKEFDGWTFFPNNHQYDEIVNPGTIDFVSVCSHHFLPFSGQAWILYVPENVLIGASKAARLVDFYSRRPQIQENLTHQILHSFVLNVKPKGAMVVMKAIHGCMSHRGVKQTRSNMTTSAVYGCLKEDKVLEHKALDLIRMSS